MAPFYAPTASGDTLWVLVGSPLGLLLGWMALMSLWAFGLMWFDKRRAKRPGARRIRERTLFLSALLGGGLGAVLGMQVFRHKTKHWYFAWGMPIILAVQVVLAVWAAYRWGF